MAKTATHKKRTGIAPFPLPPCPYPLTTCQANFAVQEFTPNLMNRVFACPARGSSSGRRVWGCNVRRLSERSAGSPISCLTRRQSIPGVHCGWHCMCIGQVTLLYFKVCISCLVVYDHRACLSRRHRHRHWLCA